MSTALQGHVRQGCQYCWSNCRLSSTLIADVWALLWLECKYKYLYWNCLRRRDGDKCILTSRFFCIFASLLNDHISWKYWPSVWEEYAKITIGGGGPTTKKTKDILWFSRRHNIFCSFCSFFEDIFLTKSGKNSKKNKKKNKKDLKGQKSWSFSFFRTHFWPNSAQKRRFWTCFEKEKKRQRTYWVFPGGMIFFVIGPPPQFTFHHKISYELQYNTKEIITRSDAIQLTVRWNTTLCNTMDHTIPTRDYYGRD